MTEKGNRSRPSFAAIETMEVFLAHAHALELEAAEHYQEMADSMEMHHNHEVAKLFNGLALSGQKHADQILARAGGRKLPQIAPWDFKWGDGEAPETPSLEGVHYMMKPYHALDLAREAEIHAQKFYAAVAETSPHPEVREMASEFAAEEAEHVERLNAWISEHPVPEEGWDDDPDPPSSGSAE